MPCAKTTSPPRQFSGDLDHVVGAAELTVSVDRRLLPLGDKRPGKGTGQRSQQKAAAVHSIT